MKYFLSLKLGARIIPVFAPFSLVSTLEEFAPTEEQFFPFRVTPILYCKG